jgi:protein PhnA
MTTRYRQHQERQEALTMLGRELTRRSRARCELCGAAGVRLFAVEVEPLPERPDPDHAVFLCEQCRDGSCGGNLDPSRWRFLESAVWSENPAVQVTAVRLCRRLDKAGVDWVADVLAGLYLSPEIEAWL